MWTIAHPIKLACLIFTFTWKTKQCGGCFGSSGIRSAQLLNQLLKTPKKKTVSTGALCGWPNNRQQASKLAAVALHPSKNDLASWVKAPLLPFSHAAPHVQNIWLHSHDTWPRLSWTHHKFTEESTAAYRSVFLAMALLQVLCEKTLSFLMSGSRLWWFYRALCQTLCRVAAERLWSMIMVHVTLD